MKRSFTLLICGIVLVSSMLSTYAILLSVNVETFSYRAFVREHQEKLNQTDLVILTTAEYNSLDKSFNGKLREFNWQGNRYDVLKTSFKDGKIYLSCFNDKKEKELDQKSASIASSLGDNGLQKNLPATIQIKIPDFFFEYTAGIVPPAAAAHQPLASLLKQSSPQGNFYLFQSPPPKA